MPRRWIFALVIVTGTTAAYAADEYFTIPVPRLHEPTSAVGQAISIAGRCYHEHIRLLVTHPGPGEISVDVAINNRSSHFDQREPFVRDLFDDMSIFQHFIVCSGTGFELTSWGGSFADQDSPRFALGQTFFDQNGRVTAYSLSPESYSYIRGHLR